MLALEGCLLLRIAEQRASRRRYIRESTERLTHTASTANLPLSPVSLPLNALAFSFALCLPGQCSEMLKWGLAHEAKKNSHLSQVKQGHLDFKRGHNLQKATL